MQIIVCAKGFISMVYACCSFLILWTLISSEPCSLYCLCLFLINLFFAIISGAYSEVKSDIANQKNKFEMDGYFKRVSENKKSKTGFH